MQIFCLSAANVRQARETSASVKTCHLIADLVKAELPTADVELMSLLELALKPCEMCGDCAQSLSCPDDQDFNSVFSRLCAADAVFLVCPHYAPIPSKLAIVLEKLEELTYIRSILGQGRSFPLRHKPIGIVAHGGGYGDGVDQYYRENLLHPLAAALRSCGLTVVGPDEQTEGVVFGVKGHLPVEGSIFPSMDHDWDDIAARLQPLVHQMVIKLATD